MFLIYRVDFLNSILPLGSFKLPPRIVYWFVINLNQRLSINNVGRKDYFMTLPLFSLRKKRKLFFIPRGRSALHGKPDIGRKVVCGLVFFFCWQSMIFISRNGCFHMCCSTSNDWTLRFPMRLNDIWFFKKIKNL